MEVETWPIAGRFTIARGSKTEAQVVVATLQDGSHRGRGESVPYARYGESVESVVAAIESVRVAVEAGAERDALQSLLPAGAARNALDCALWDLDAKKSGVPAHTLAGLDRLRPAVTAYTLSLDTPEAMGEAAKKASARPILKIKLGGAHGDHERLAAVRAGAPDATLIVDANEGWRPENFDAHMEACLAAGVALIEQPFPAAEDSALAGLFRPVPLCADESVHAREGLERLTALYDVVNIKLDKTGGLTEALALAEEAERLGLGLMIGCMVGTSLAMAPALLLAARARFVDLDGPLLLERDRAEGLTYHGSIVEPPASALWG